MKKAISIFVSAVIVFSALSAGFNVFADDKEIFDISITAGKSNYGIPEIAEITATVKNISENTVSGVAIAFTADDYLIPANEKSAVEIGDLAPGESRSYTIRAAVNRKAKGIKFFDKITLFFKQLFKKYSSLTEYIPEHKNYESKSVSISHSYFNVPVTVKVWYSVFTSQELENMNKVDDCLTKSENITDGLESLLNLGLIKNYMKSGNMSWFTYSNGTLGGVMTDEFSDTSEDKSQQAGSITDIPQNKLDVYEQYSVGRALILYSFNYPSDMTDQNYRRPFYDSKDSSSLVNQWGLNQVMTDVDDTVTVHDIKNIDAKYDVVCFSGHGSTVGTTPVMCLTEKVTDENKQEYADDLINKRIITVTYDGGTYYWAFPSIFDTYESDGLKNKLMFFQCCEAFGEGNTENYQFADKVISAGADAAIGFHNSVSSQYGRNFMSSFISSYYEGKTVSESFEAAKKSEGNNDAGYKSAGEPVAKPVVRGNLNSVFLNNKYAVMNVTVFDNTEKVIDTLNIKIKSGSSITSSFISNAVKDLFGYITAVMQNYSIIAENGSNYTVSTYKI